MAFEADVDAVVFRRLGAFAQRFDQLVLDLGIPIVAVGHPGAVGAHRAGAGVDAAGAELVGDAHGGLQGAHGLATQALVGGHQRLPIAGDLVEVQALVGEQVAQAVALGGAGVEGVVLGKAGEDTREAERFDPFGNLGGEVVHIARQKSAAHSEAHKVLPFW